MPNATRNSAPLRTPGGVEGVSYEQMTVDELRVRFLDRVDQYLAGEATKSPQWQVQSHEAGGAWRIAFSHRRLRPNAAFDLHMSHIMRARWDWAKANFFHGFPDEAEVHHEIEIFNYFQLPLYRAGQGSRD